MNGVTKGVDPEALLAMPQLNLCAYALKPGSALRRQGGVHQGRLKYSEVQLDLGTQRIGADGEWMRTEGAGDRTRRHHMGRDPTQLGGHRVLGPRGEGTQHQHGNQRGELQNK